MLNIDKAWRNFKPRRLFCVEMASRRENRAMRTGQGFKSPFFSPVIRDIKISVRIHFIGI